MRDDKRSDAGCVAALGFCHEQALRNAPGACDCHAQLWGNCELVAASPAQMLWGSDFPFLGMSGESRPTVTGLFGLFCEWTSDPGLREQILSANPARVYGFT